MTTSPAALLNRPAVAARLGISLEELARIVKVTRSANIPGAPIVSGHGNRRIHLRWREPLVESWYARALDWLACQPIPDATPAPALPVKAPQPKARPARSRKAAQAGADSVAGESLHAKARRLAAG